MDCQTLNGIWKARLATLGWLEDASRLLGGLATLDALSTASRFEAALRVSGSSGLLVGHAEGSGLLLKATLGWGWGGLVVGALTLVAVIAAQ